MTNNDRSRSDTRPAPKAKTCRPPSPTDQIRPAAVPLSRIGPSVRGGGGTRVIHVCTVSGSKWMGAGVGGLTVCLRAGRYRAGLMRLESVAFRYRRRDPWVFRDVTLTFPPGRVTEVTGRNGAGKSTLLRVIAGLRSPRKGVVKDRPDRVGYAPERFPVNQPFTVSDYLGHMAAIRHVPANTVTAWVERLAIGHLLDVRLPELSKGSAQKVGLAQALMDDPGLLILDEPFAGLDAATRDTLPELMAEMATAGATVVVSDHQRCIEALPGIDRLRVADGAVTRAPSAKTDWAVLEVEVPADEADTVETKLRTDGYRVRRTDR